MMEELDLTTRLVPGVRRSLRILVEDYLRQFAGRTILYHPNPGNGGDGIIATGTLQMLRRLGVNIRVISLEDSVKGEIVLLAGGGNLVPLYKDMAAAVAKFRNDAARIIVLPHTIRGNEDLLRSLDHRFCLFCRDATSYLHVIKYSPKAEVHLAHDMAFHIDVNEIFADPFALSESSRIISVKLERKGISLADITDPEKVNFSRLDWESKREKPTSMLDLSDTFALGVAPRESLLSATCILRCVQQARKVVTDRLHVAIACALVGTACDMGDNSYKKNSSVWSHSIRAYFPHVAFEGEEDETND